MPFRLVVTGGDLLRSSIMSDNFIAAIVQVSVYLYDFLHLIASAVGALGSSGHPVYCADS